MARDFMLNRDQKAMIWGTWWLKQPINPKDEQK